MRAVAYVDGSFNIDNGISGYGIVFITDEKEEYLYGACNGASWNVTGEIQAALEATRKAIREGYESIHIFYDYTGIENWATKTWKAKKPETIVYAKEMQKLMEKMNISFTHVKAHTGDKYNEKADQLAKYGAGITFTADENWQLCAPTP